MVKRTDIHSLTRIALSGAVLYASQAVLSSLPNIEIVTLMIVVFTRNLGKEGIYACFVYTGLTAVTSGVGLWWFTYLVVWPAFALLAYKLRENKSPVFWAIINASFGLSFGVFFALPYIFVSPSYALSYWTAGIPWDITHCIGNFVTTIFLEKPLDDGLKKALKYKDGY